MTFRPVLSLALATGMLAACSSGTDTAEEEDTAPEPVLTPAPTPTVDEDGRPLAEGSWQVGEDALGARAMFGEEATEPRLTIQCNRARGAVEMILSGPADGPDTYIIEAGGQAASLDMEPTGEELPAMAAEIEPGAPVFAGFSQPGGVISIMSADGSDGLKVPTAPGIERVFFACE